MRSSKKPQKRSVDYLLENASDQQIRKLLNDDGTIGSLNVNEMKFLMGYGKTQKLPEPKGYSTEKLTKIRDYIKEKRPAGLESKLQAIDLAE